MTKTELLEKFRFLGNDWTEVDIVGPYGSQGEVEDIIYEGDRIHIVSDIMSG